MLIHFYILVPDSFCCEVSGCVKSGGFDKIIFGTGTKLIVNSRKFLFPTNEFCLINLDLVSDKVWRLGLVLDRFLETEYTFS